MSIRFIDKHNDQEAVRATIEHARGRYQAALEHEKNEEKRISEAKTPTAPSPDKKAFEITLGQGENAVHVTYTHEELQKHAVSEPSGDQTEQENGPNASIYLELDVDTLFQNDSAHAANTAASAFPKTNPLELALMTAKDLNINISIKMGNDVLVVGSNVTAKISKQVGTDQGQQSIFIGNDSDVNIQSRVDLEDSDDVLIVGSHARVSITQDIGTDRGDDVLIVGDHAEAQITSRVGVDNSDDLTILDDHSRLVADATIGTDNSNDTLIMGQHSEAIIKSSIGTSSGTSTVIMGDHSRLVVESETGSASGNSTVILGDHAELIIKGQTGASSGQSTIILGKGARLTYEGTSGTAHGDSTYLVGKNLSLHIRFNIDGNREAARLTKGQDPEKLFEEIREIGKRLEKWKIGNRSLKDILEDTMQKLRKSWKLFSRQRQQEVNTWENPFAKTQATLYRLFDHQLTGIQILQSYVNHQYLHSKEDAKRHPHGVSQSL